MQSVLSSQQPIVVCGTEGSSKGSVAHLAFSYHKEFIYPLPHTTIPLCDTPVECHSITLEEFQRMMAEDKFIEAISPDDGIWMGMSVEAFLAAANTPNRRCMLLVDTAAVKSLKRLCPDLDAIYVFIAPESYSEAESFLLSSKLPSRQSRLDEFREAFTYAESGAYDAIIINDNPTHAALSLIDLAFGKGGGRTTLGDAYYRS